MFAVWLSAFGLSLNASAREGRLWLRFDEEAAKQLRTALVQMEADVRTGKLPADIGKGLTVEINRRLQELEAELPGRKRWFAVGQADAQRDIARGILRYYSIDESLFLATAPFVCGFDAPPQAVWNRAMASLTGASIVSVWPRGNELSLLTARVEGYNHEVWNHLRARHGADIELRVDQEAKRLVAGIPPGRWEVVEPFVPFAAALIALSLLGRLVELRKRRERLAAPIGAH